MSYLTPLVHPITLFYFLYPCDREDIISLFLIFLWMLMLDFYLLIKLYTIV